MKLMPDLNLRVKILTGFGLVLVILLIVFTISLSSLLKLGKASDAILRQNYLSIEATNNMLDAIEQHYRIVFELFQLNTSDRQKQQLDERMRFEHWLTIEKGNITEKGELDAAKNLEKSYKNYLINVQAFEAEKHGSLQEALDFLNARVRPELNGIRSYCYKIMTINQEVMFRASNNARRIAHKATYTLIITGIIGILLATIFSLSLSSLIVRPLKKILGALEKVAGGDYSTRIEYDSKDELGIVSNEFNVMAQKLSEYHELNILSIMREKQINEAILQNMDDGLFLIDTDFRITSANLSGARLFRTDPLKCKGMHILELIRSDILFDFVKTTVQQGKSPAFADGQNIYVVEHGTNKQYLQYFLTPVFLQPEILLGVLILFNDVTHLKLLDKLKSEFLMIASHELKTPLTSINMSISLLRETIEPKLSNEEKELLQIAQDDTNRLKALINDLLDISKIEAGKIELDFEKIPVTSIVNKSMESFQTMIQDKEINVSSSIDDSLQVRGDFSKIAWIMTNLISNAIRFTPVRGSIRCKVEKSGSFALFSIADNGIGISQENISKIFDKFFQVSSPLNTGGTGLGLSICKEIVRAHGGSIWVESEPENGSTFYFTLPLA